MSLNLINFTINELWLSLIITNKWKMHQTNNPLIFVVFNTIIKSIALYWNSWNCALNLGEPLMFDQVNENIKIIISYTNNKICMGLVWQS